MYKRKFSQRNSNVLSFTFSAIVSGQIERTLAIELVGKVNAGGRWRTRVLFAVNNVLVAVFPRKSGRTYALVPGPVVDARRSIFTRVGLTRVELVLATDSVIVARARAV